MKRRFNKFLQNIHLFITLIIMRSESYYAHTRENITRFSSLKNRFRHRSKRWRWKKTGRDNGGALIEVKLIAAHVTRNQRARTWYVAEKCTGIIRSLRESTIAADGSTWRNIQVGNGRFVFRSISTLPEERQRLIFFSPAPRSNC